jgi:hypothetical protein
VKGSNKCADKIQALLILDGKVSSKQNVPGDQDISFCCGTQIFIIIIKKFLLGSYFGLVQSTSMSGVPFCPHPFQTNLNLPYFVTVTQTHKKQVPDTKKYFKLEVFEYNTNFNLNIVQDCHNLMQIKSIYGVVHNFVQWL